MANSFLFYSSYNVSWFLCYSESKYFENLSRLGIIKFKLDHALFVLAQKIYLWKCIKSFVGSQSTKSVRTLLSRSFSSVSFGFASKYRIKGLGHRIYIYKNNVLFKIGYSHLLYKVLDYNLINAKKRFKKERYFAIRGMDYMNLRRSQFIMQSYRVPNCYCFNGIFVHGLIVDPKESKRGFLL